MMTRFFTQVYQAACDFGFNAKINQKSPWPLEVYDGTAHLFSVNKIGGVCIEEAFYNSPKAHELYYQISVLKNSVQNEPNIEIPESSDNEPTMTL